MWGRRQVVSPHMDLFDRMFSDLSALSESVLGHVGAHPTRERTEGGTEAQGQGQVEKDRDASQTPQV